MNDKNINDVEYITYALTIPKYKIVDYKFSQSNDYLQTELIHQLEKENQELKERIEIMEKYFELISDLGYDYDGLNQADNLKTLIDELVRYSNLGRVCNTTEPIYINENKQYNILHKEIGGK